jgi:Zn-dependent M28 family amino/carboxypeptidase
LSAVFPVREAAAGSVPQRGAKRVTRNLIAIAAMLGVLGPDSRGAEAPGNDSICQRDIKADLFFLSGDRFRGRLTATPENDLASAFIASRFERLGLKALGAAGSFDHGFNLVTASLGPSNHSRIAGTTRLLPGQGYIPLPFSPPGEQVLVQPVVFVGFGIVAPERGHDDYRGRDVRNKFVLVLDHEPGEDDPKSRFDGVVMSEAAVPIRKALTAQEKGAIGILFVSDVHNHPEPENFEALAHSIWPEKPPRIPQYYLQDWVDRVRIPASRISVVQARALFQEAGGSFENLARASERPAEAPTVPRDLSSVELATDIRHHVVPDRNVLAALEGSDPKLKDDWVIISCHQDHNGADGGQVFNGADDNGSGVVGVLEIAEAYAIAARDGHRPRRSILFAAFNSEERGLLGSWAFVERPPVPLDRIVAVLNMDMVGRDEEVPERGGPRFRGLPVQSAESNRNAVNLLGYSRCASLTRTIESANAAIGLTLKQVLDNNSSNLLRRSDQWPFLQRGVPAIFIHTGLHPDYHTPADRPERINYPKMERIVRLVHQASWDLAQQPDRPRLDASSAGTLRR